MKNTNGTLIRSPRGRGTLSPTLRDVVSGVFRQRRLALLSFLGISLGVALYVLVRPQRYESQIKILLNRERVEPVVSADPNATSRTGLGITEQELNSELELLKSRDVLEKVVVACKLDQPTRVTWWTGFKHSLGDLFAQQPESREQRIGRAVFGLESQLVFDPLQRSNLIKVTYTSTDAALSARVLNKLADFYIEKHLEVHRPHGAFDFFQRETQRYRQELALAQDRLASYGHGLDGAEIQAERDVTVKNLGGFEKSLQETRADIAATKERIRNLESKVSETVPHMLTTEVRTTAARPPDHLQSTLLDLELKKAELLGLFQPDYPLVTQVERQITAAKSAIANSEKTPFVEKTTSIDPAYEWSGSELTKARNDLAGLEARATSLTRIIHTYRGQVSEIDRIEVGRQDLVRAFKLAEQNYLTYFQKQESARISDALDRDKIVNVTVAEAATVPYLPVGPSGLTIFLLGIVGALASSLLLGFGFDRLDPSFHEPAEVEAYLDIPVIAALPRNTD